MNYDKHPGSARILAGLAGPAFILALAACGGGQADTAATTVAAESVPAATESAPIEPEATEPATAESTEPEAAQPAEPPAAEPTEPAEPAEPVAVEAAPVAIETLSADEAIANAQANIGGLQAADSVLDIEVLAVADGSVQTMRDVVAGDRPVLLWFFSPH